MSRSGKKSKRLKYRKNKRNNRLKPNKKLFKMNRIAFKKPKLPKRTIKSRKPSLYAFKGRMRTTGKA